MTQALVFFLLALAASLALTPLCRLVAHRLGFVARPKEDRWHKRPTALFGGVAIAMTTLVLGVAIGPDARLWQLLGCGLVVAGFGLADDVLSLKASTKLILQITVASALLFFGFRLHWTDSLVFDAMFTLFWIVGITNGLNLLDNMDGLCAGTTLIAGTFLLVGIINGGGVTAPAVYMAVLLGATAGFLFYNIHPASIFMGDAGSLFLGFNLAALDAHCARGRRRCRGLRDDLGRRRPGPASARFPSSTPPWSRSCGCCPAGVPHKAGATTALIVWSPSGCRNRLRSPCCGRSRSVVADWRSRSSGRTRTGPGWSP